MKCDRLVGYLHRGKYTYIVLKVLIEVISLLLWSCQWTGKKKVRASTQKKSATVNQKYKDSLQRYSEFLLTLRIDVHVPYIISGLETWTFCQTPLLHCFLVPEIYFIAIFILFVSLKFKSNKSFAADINSKRLLYRLVDRWQSRPYDNNLANSCLDNFSGRRMYSRDPWYQRRHLYVLKGLKMY